MVGVTLNEINGMPVKTLADFKSAIAQSRTAKPILPSKQRITLRVPQIMYW